MTSAQATENRIIQNLLNGPSYSGRPAPGRPASGPPAQGRPAPGHSATPGADRLIRLITVTAILFLCGSYLQELLWVALAAATIAALGFKK